MAMGNVGVFANILSNAVKFSFVGGEITVKCWHDKKYVRVSFADRGIGMSEELKNKVFSPHEATSRRGTEGEAGTGFGMPIVKSMVEIFGGDVSVTSYSHEKSSEHGTTFTIKLLRSDYNQQLLAS